MAFDKAGKYHMSPHHAKMQDESKPKKPSKESEIPGKSEPDSKGATDHEDGEDGTSMDDGTEAIHSHLTAMHEAHGGKHMHVHSKEDGSHTTHHIDETGEPQGPHHHPDSQSLNDHIAMTMDGGGGQQMAAPMGAPAPMHQAAPVMGGY